MVIVHRSITLEIVPMADTATSDKTAATPAASAAKPVLSAAPKTDAAKPQPPTTAKPVVARRKPGTTVRKALVKTPITRNRAATAASAKKEKTMDVFKTTTAKADTVFADATARAKGAVDKSQKMLGEMNDFSKGNLEAIVESSKIAARGIEAMSQDAVAYAKKSFEDAAAAARQIASVKSPTEFMKLQSDYVRTSFDAMVAHTSKSTEAMLKLAGEVAQPISNRVSLAAEKVKLAA